MDMGFDRHVRYTTRNNESCKYKPDQTFSNPVLWVCQNADFKCVLCGWRPIVLGPPIVFCQNWQWVLTAKYYTKGQRKITIQMSALEVRAARPHCQILAGLLVYFMIWVGLPLRFVFNVYPSI
jgi:hypothetical protein